MWNELVLMMHPALGVFAVLASVWVFVETLNARADNQTRIRMASWAAAVFMWGAYLVGGYWYVLHYAPDKALITAGPWPFAHDFVMETKEHVFLSLLLLASYLPIAASSNLAASKGARSIVLGSAALLVLMGLAMEGSGAFIAMAAKVALLAK